MDRQVPSRIPADLARSPEGAAVIVDALFGAGLDRPVAGEDLAAVQRINAACCPVIAVDLPSGINGTTGAVMGAAVRAAETVTFFRKKPGHLLLPGRMFCGSVEVAEIGIPDAVLDKVKPRSLREHVPLWGPLFPVPDMAGPQIQPRPCRRGVGRHCPYRRGAACRDGGAARRRRAGDAGVAARRACRQCREQSRRHGAAGRCRGRVRGDARRSPLQRRGDRAGRRGRLADARDGPRRAGRIARRRARCRCPDELCRFRPAALRRARPQPERCSHAAFRRVPPAVRQAAPRASRRPRCRNFSPPGRRRASPAPWWCTREPIP